MVVVPFSIFFSCFCPPSYPAPLTRLARPRSESVPGSFLKFSLKAIKVQPKGLHVPAELFHRYSRMGMQPGAVSSGFDSVVMMS